MAVVLIVLLTIVIGTMFVLFLGAIGVAVKLMSGQPVIWGIKNILSVVTFIPILALFFTVFDEDFYF